MVCITFIPYVCIIFISALAETNRPPFDLPEAEAELVVGYQTDIWNDVCNVLVREYANILLLRYGLYLFLGGWLPPLDIPIFSVVPILVNF